MGRAIGAVTGTYVSRLGVQVDTMDTVRPAYLLGIHSLIPSLFRKTRVRRILAEEGRRVAAAALLPTSLMAKDVCTIKHEMYVIGIKLLGSPAPGALRGALQEPQ